MQAGVSSRKQSAFTLVEVAIVLLLVGLLVAGGIGVLSSIRTTKGIGDTREQIEEVVRALRVFLVRNNRLPCPAIATLDDDHEDYGEEANFENFCAGAIVGDSGDTRIGVVPFRSLRLGGASEQLDGWNQQFTYQVLLSATQEGWYDAIAWTGPFVELWDEDEVIVPDGVVGIVSHGSNGNGAFLIDGTRSPLPPAGSYESRNVDSDEELASVDYSDDPDKPFDDIVLVLTEDDIVQPLVEQGALQSRQARALENLKRIKNAIIGYMSVGDPIEGCAAPPNLTELALPPETTVDPWGNNDGIYVYCRDASHLTVSPLVLSCQNECRPDIECDEERLAFQVSTDGRDGLPGTTDDIVVTMSVQEAIGALGPLLMNAVCTSDTDT